MKQISNIQEPSSIDKSLKKKQTNVNETGLCFKKFNDNIGVTV